MPSTRSSRGLYHWWEEPLRSERSISAAALRPLLNDRLRAFGADNFRELLVGKLGLKQSDYVRCWRLATGRQHSIRTINLIRICDKLRVHYAELERRKVFADRLWPIGLKQPELTMLKSHILNEGTVNSAVVKAVYSPTGKVSLSKRTTAHFYNNDPVLHGHIRWLARKCGSSATTVRSRVGYTTILDGTTSRIMQRIGVPSGRRANRRIKLDPNVIRDENLWKYHFCSTLIEEGYCSLRLSASGRLSLEVGYYRGTDITRIFPTDETRRLLSGIRTPIGNLSEQNQQVVRDNPPVLMVHEIEHLRGVHSQAAVDPRVWPEPHPYEIKRCFGGTRIIAGWRFATSRRALVEILSAYFNVSIPSLKRRHMLEICHVYRKHGTRRISLGDWSQLKKRIHRLCL